MRNVHYLSSFNLQFVTNIFISEFRFFRFRFNVILEISGNLFPISGCPFPVLVYFTILMQQYFAQCFIKVKVKNTIKPKEHIFLFFRANAITVVAVVKID